MTALALLIVLASPQGLETSYQALRDKRFDDAIRSFEATVAATPKLLPKAWGWGMALYGRGDLAGASDLFERILAGDPGNVRALYGRALVLMRSGGDPAPDLRAALRSAPDDVRCRFRLGQALAERGAHGEAVEELRGVLARRWIHQPARHALILSLRDLDDLVGAQAAMAEFQRIEPLVDRIGAAERAVRRRPDDMRAKARLRAVYSQAGRPR